MRIVFFGSSPVSCRYLSELSKSEKIILAVTRPDKPAGRGKKLHATSVKACASGMGIPVLTPNDPKDGDFMTAVERSAPDLGIVVAYGRILPDKLLSFFRYGCLNVHFSLLPKYRGAAPVQWAVMNGEKETGVTVFLLDSGLDTGAVFVQKKAVVGADENADAVQEKLTPLGIEALGETIGIIRKAAPGNMKELLSFARKQEGEPSFAPPLSRDISPVRWPDDAESIHNRARGLQPWPAACSCINGKALKIFETEPVEGGCSDSRLAPGEIAGVEKNKGILVKCGSGMLLVKTVQSEGRGRMSAWQFWQGARLKIGDRFE